MRTKAYAGGPALAGCSYERHGETRIFGRFLYRIRADGHRRHDTDQQPGTTIGILDDFGDEARQPRHLGQTEGDSVFGEFAETPTVI
jgi:hypothetical protein